MQSCRLGGAFALRCAVGLLWLGLMAAPAAAITVKGSAVLEDNPEGVPVSSTVTFSLPHHAWISGVLWVNPEPQWVGEHTCQILASETGDPANGGQIEPGNTTVYARLQRGRKPGSVFLAEVTRNPDLSLFNAGCDGIPGNGDAFEGHAAALFAAPAVYVAQALESVARHPEAISVREEIYEAFGIDPERSNIEPKLLEFHSFEPPANPGGSATGYSSAQVALKFRSP